MGLRRFNVATCEFVAVGVANWMPCPQVYHVTRALVSCRGTVVGRRESACPPKFRVTAYTLGNGHSGHLVLVCITVSRQGVFRRSAAAQIHSSSSLSTAMALVLAITAPLFAWAFTHGLSDPINP